MKGLRRKTQFEDLGHGPNVNVALPQNIASQIIDSPYFRRLLGEELAGTHEDIQVARDQTRATERHAAENNIPLQELRAVIETIRPPPNLEPFAGQAQHEARAAQQDLMARLEQQGIGLAEVQRQQFAARQSAEALGREHGQTLSGLATQFAKTHKQSFKARADSSSASEPGGEPAIGRATGSRGR